MDDQLNVTPRSTGFALSGLISTVRECQHLCESMYKYELTCKCTANHHHTFNRLVHFDCNLSAAFLLLRQKLLVGIAVEKSSSLRCQAMSIDVKCNSGMSPSGGGISPLHSLNLTQRRFKRDRRIAAGVPSYQSIPLQENN